MKIFLNYIRDISFQAAVSSVKKPLTISNRRRRYDVRVVFFPCRRLAARANVCES